MEIRLAAASSYEFPYCTAVTTNSTNAAARIERKPAPKYSSRVLRVSYIERSTAM
jgi:hypothetical protein